MPTVFKPLPPGDPRGPGWFRSYVPTGSDLGAQCAENGWTLQTDPSMLLLDEKGNVLQEPPEGEPKQKHKPHKEVSPDE